MPPDRNHIPNPQGRQKSCTECAKAKRKCDLQQPHCLRCTRQKLTCSYPPQPHASKRMTPKSLVSTPIVDEGLQEAPAPFDFDIDIQDITSAEAELLNFDFDVPVNPLGRGDDQDLDRRLITDMPTPCSASSSKKSLPIFSMFMLSPLVESRVVYPLEQMKLAPKMFVEKNATHWSHPMLYEDYMPNPLQGGCSRHKFVPVWLTLTRCVCFLCAVPCS
jgi:hypothetical protein